MPKKQDRPIPGIAAELARTRQRAEVAEAEVARLRGILDALPDCVAAAMEAD
jgi:hypothetical protein